MSNVLSDKQKATSAAVNSEKYNPGEIELKWPHSAKATRGMQANEKYDSSSIEPYWQAVWQREKTYQPDLENATSSPSGTNRKPFYNLMMFPYPSAEGLHVGNMYAFTGADVYGRYKRMTGHTVFEPIGLDGFGIHSENYALKIGSHPMEQVEISEKNYYRQLQSIGNGYDWTHTVETYKPDYYRWTQWVFIQLFKAGLAYRAAAEVNWCPSCQTVLADEQVIDGKCERCSTEVEKRDLKQWFFRITGYSERLLRDLEKIDWTEKVKLAQKNWIGKSEGALVKFVVLSSQVVGEDIAPNESPKNEEPRTTNANELEVFTTRPDTLHGATFMVVSPEHPIVASLLNSKSEIRNPKIEEIKAYIQQAKGKSDRDRKDATKEKTGVFSGLFAVNPVNGQQIPIWIADYVLMGYGTGAIMAVPAHDQRDYEFAKKFDLPITEVISGGDVAKEAYTGQGTLVNSGAWDGWETPEARTKAIEWLEKEEIGQKNTNYHLRDWLISRQRYWGAPIPMIYCESCADEGKSWFTSSEYSEYSENQNVRRSDTSESQTHRNTESSESSESAGWPAGNASRSDAGWYPDENLPVVLPHIDDYRPVGTGKAPLANHPEFYETTCPACGSPAKRETDVADTFLDSSWYFLRYPATDLKNIPFPMKTSELQSFKASEQEERLRAEKRTAWLPVSQYIGGAEHSVLHLLYARFVYKVFADLGFLDISKGDEPFPKFFAHGLIIKEGAKMSKSKGNVVVPDLYIKKYGADTLRTYLMFLGPFSEGGDFQDAGIDGINRYLRRVWKLFTTQTLSSSIENPSANVMMHRTIKGVSSDLASLRYNTAIAKLMTWYNALAQQQTISQEEVTNYLKLLAPFAPHMTEELYQRLESGIEDQESRDNLKSNKPDRHNSSFIIHDSFTSIHTSSWPNYDEAFLIDQTITIAIQVNGKLRDTLTVQKEISDKQEEVESLAKVSVKVQNFIEGKEIRKTIYIPGKVLNLVV